MNVLHVTPILGPANGGSAVIPYELAKEQARMGHQVTIATSDHRLDRALLRTPENVRIEPFPCGRAMRSSFYSPGMKEWMRDHVHEYDIVHVHNLRSYQSIIARRFAASNGTPFVLQSHGSAQIVAGRALMKNIFDLLWGRRIIRDAAACVAVSEHEVAHYAGLGAPEASIVVIPNALSDPGSAGSDRNVFRTKYGVPDDTKVLLYLGRLNRRKDIDVLVRAFSQLYRENGKMLLVIVGPDDGHERALRALVSRLGLDEAIKFYGFIDDPAVAYRGADLVVNPSRQEIFGLVPFEAVLCGTPVVVCNDSGCGEMVSKARCGIAVPPDDPQALVEAIQHLLDHPQEGSTLVKNGRAYIEEHLTWRSVAREFEQLYERSIQTFRASDAEGPPDRGRPSP